MTNKKVMILWCQIVMILLILFILMFFVIPNNVIDTHKSLRFMDQVSNLGLVLVLVMGIPIGVVGIKNVKKQDSVTFLDFITKYLAIANVVAGFVEWAVFLLMMVALFNGANH